MIKCPYCDREFINSNSVSPHAFKSHNVSCENLYRKICPDVRENCLNCGTKTKFVSLLKGFRKYCCNKCSQTHQKNDVDLKRRKIEKLKSSKFLKYGDENYSNLDKSKETNIKKYGVENIFERVDLIKIANIKKYGVDHHMKCKSVYNKYKRNMMSSYGVENQFQRPTIKDEIKNTRKTQQSKILKKIKSTMLDRYGVDNAMKSEMVRDKARSTIRKNTIDHIFNGNRLCDKLVPLFDASEYKDVKSQYKFKCIECNSVVIGDLDAGKIPRCQTCFPICPGKSEPEKEIVSFLESIIPNVEIVKNTRKVIRPLELDIYIPYYKTAIEYNGLHWHTKEFGGKDENYHLNKTVLCENINVKLIHIFEDDWCDNQEVTKDNIKNVIFSTIPVLSNYPRHIYNKSCFDKNIHVEESNKRMFYLNRKEKSGEYRSNERTPTTYSTFYDCGDLILS